MAEKGEPRFEFGREEEVEHSGLPGMWAELSIEGLDRPRSYSYASAPKNENPKERHTIKIDFRFIMHRLRMK